MFLKALTDKIFSRYLAKRYFQVWQISRVAFQRKSLDTLERFLVITELDSLNCKLSNIDFWPRFFCQDELDKLNSTQLGE